MTRLLGLSCALGLVMIGGCGKDRQKESHVSGVVLTDLVDLRRVVRQSIKYDRFNDALGCNIRNENGAHYCVDIDGAVLTTESGGEFIYAVENGSPLNDDGEKDESHVALGSLKFFKYELIKDKVRLVAESELIGCGPYGSPCGARTYRIGVGPELGWVLTSGDMHQGHSGSRMDAYALFEDKIKLIFSIQTSYSNEMAYGDSDSLHPMLDISTKITTMPGPSARFFDLDVTVAGTEKFKKKETAIGFGGILKFDFKKGEYDTSALRKFYEGREY